MNLNKVKKQMEEFSKIPAGKKLMFESQRKKFPVTLMGKESERLGLRKLYYSDDRYQRIDANFPNLREPTQEEINTLSWPNPKQ